MKKIKEIFERVMDFLCYIFCGDDDGWDSEGIDKTITGDNEKTLIVKFRRIDG